MTPVATCTACSENLSPYLTADFASYTVMFLVGLLATPAILVVSATDTDEVTRLSASRIEIRAPSPVAGDVSRCGLDIALTYETGC